jgi:hypothetical protein
MDGGECCRRLQCFSGPRITHGRRLLHCGTIGLWPQWVLKAMSALSPFDSQLRTLVGAARRSHSCHKPTFAAG